MAKLAIHGGSKINPAGYTVWPYVTEKDREYINNVLDSGTLWGAYAPQVKALQNEWKDYVGTKYCIASNSGTTALHMAVAAAGIGPGDEVITTAYTFVASALAVLQQNAVPVFADIDPKTYNIDPKDIERKITPRTKAIIPVHLHGLPCDMDAINAIAKKHNLIVIEDACQAHGAKYHGRNAGTLADMAAFSLNSTKNLPGVDGGLFNTDSEEFFLKARQLRDLGEVAEEGIERDYNAFGVGWQYRYTEFSAAFTRSHLTTLDAENKIRVANANYLTEKLAAYKGIITPYVPEGVDSVFYLYRLRLDPKALGIDMDPNTFRAKVQMAIRAEGLEANRWQNRPVPMQALFQDKMGYGKGCPWSCPYGKGMEVIYREEDYPVTNQVAADSFVLLNTIFPPYGKEMGDTFINCIDKLWNNMDEVLKIEVDPTSIYMRK